jgi:hypothetical protein
MLIDRRHTCKARCILEYFFANAPKNSRQVKFYFWEVWLDRIGTKTSNIWEPGQLSQYSNLAMGWTTKESGFNSH